MSHVYCKTCKNSLQWYCIILPKEALAVASPSKSSFGMEKIYFQKYILVHETFCQIRKKSVLREIENITVVPLDTWERDFKYCILIEQGWMIWKPRTDDPFFLWIGLELKDTTHFLRDLGDTLGYYYYSKIKNSVD